MLTLRNVGLELVPSSVSELKHLRYLDLSGNFSIKELPTSITELVNLQTLKLTGCYNLLRLPEEISKLVNLRHLEFDESNRITHTPRGLGQLTNLQTLSQLVLSENPCSGKLGELKQLNLRGNLTIKGLKNGLEPKEAKLKDKQHLQSLCLDFTTRGGDALTNEQESETTVLEGLQPHPNLRKLIVASYGGDRFSSWFSLLTNLVKLCLENCSRCRQLPSLDRCHSLEELVLKDLNALEYITVNEDDSFFSTSSSSSVLSVLPSLQKLTLEGLPNFRRWWRSDMAESQEEQVVFPRLSSLTISSCPCLTSMPCYPNVEKLRMEFTSSKHFERTMLLRVPQAQISATTTTDQASSSAASSSTASTVSLSFNPLSKLLSLSLKGIVDLHHFPNEWMNGLASLKILRFMSCHRLNCLTPYIHYLTSLEELDIDYCKQLEGIKWPETPALTRLRILKLKRLPNLKNLPSQGIRYLTSLEELDIADCQQFEGIEWPKTPAFTSLHILTLQGLPELKNLLSQGIQHLTSLSELRIMDCRKLDVYDDSIQWIVLTNLRTLVFEVLPQLRTLPEGLQSVTTLEDLQIRLCENFTGLRRGIHMLSSLQRLIIYSCSNFKSVPGSISSLTSLQHLEINGMQMDPREISEDLDLSL